MMTADHEALTACVIMRHSRSTRSSFAAVVPHARSAGMWTALTVYHNAGHRYTHLRASAEFSSACIGDRDLGFSSQIRADKGQDDRWMTAFGSDDRFARTTVPSGLGRWTRGDKNKVVSFFIADNYG
jgi:hypothetical protein